MEAFFITAKSCLQSGRAKILFYSDFFFLQGNAFPYEETQENQSKRCEELYCTASWLMR